MSLSPCSHSLGIDWWTRSIWVEWEHSSCKQPTTLIFWENLGPKRDAKKMQNGRKSAQNHANGRKLKKRYLMIFHKPINLLLVNAICFQVGSWFKLNMSTDRLSSCNTLAGGCDMVDSKVPEQLSATQEARAAIAAKIQAPKMLVKPVFCCRI